MASLNLNPATRYKSSAHSSTGTQSGLRSRNPSTACRLLVSWSFHSPPGVLFTVPSRYWFTIGHSGIFSLTRWSSQIHTEFHVLHATRESLKLYTQLLVIEHIKIGIEFEYKTFTFYGIVFGYFVTNDIQQFDLCFLKIPQP